MLPVPVLTGKSNVVGFNPARFFGKGWKVKSMTSKKSNNIVNQSVIDLSRGDIETTLIGDEQYVLGSEVIHRLKMAKKSMMGIDHFMAIMKDSSLVPHDWHIACKEYLSSGVFFNDIILTDPEGDEHALGILLQNGKVIPAHHWLGHRWDKGHFSAVIKE